MPHVRHESAIYAITSGEIISQLEDGNYEAYEILENKGKLLKILDYENPDLCGAHSGTGFWNLPDIVTTYNNIKVVNSLINGASTGPELRIYDISDFIHDEENE